MKSSKLIILEARINDWWDKEGSAHRWKSLDVKALMDEFLAWGKESQRDYDRIAQRCDPTGEVQMLHDMQERAEAADKERRETEEVLRSLAWTMSLAHSQVCRRLESTTRRTLWDIEGCTRCKGEQTLEDLRTALHAENQASSSG